MAEEQYTMSSDVSGWYTLPDDIGTVTGVTVYGQDMLQLDVDEPDADQQIFTRDGEEIVYVSILDCAGVNELILSMDDDAAGGWLGERITVKISYLPKNLLL